MEKKNPYLVPFEYGASEVGPVELKKDEEIDLEVYFDWSEVTKVSKDWSVTVWAPDGSVKIWNATSDIKSDEFHVIEGEKIEDEEYEEPATDDEEIEDEEPAIDDEDNEE